MTMDEVNGEFAPVSELDSMFENIDTEMLPSDSVQMNAKESNAVPRAENKGEHVKESTTPLEDEKIKEHETGESSNEENTNVEMKNKEDMRSEAKDDEKLEVDSRKNVSKLSKKPRKLKNKNVLSRQRVKGVTSMTKLDKDSRIGNVDAEVVPADVIKMNGKESSIPASMSDKNDMTNVVGIEMVTADKNRTIDKFDVGLATSKPAKMNGKESDVEGKDEHLKESMVSGDGKKKECGISEVSNQESIKEEAKNEEKPIHRAKNEEKLEAKIKKKMNRLRKRGKQKKAALRGTNEVAAKYTDNPETSKKKSKMTAKGTGMIFMCSSKTKRDCYHYKVLGLPASKRDMVFKICAGMKLFLFDIDSKLMYGIYKAAGPGGYNIEPKAFNSAFPSQVRFAVQEDCTPLAEKDFKKIIKDNYFTENKFHCELTLKQVKDLCKLFRVSVRSSKSTRLLRARRAEAPRYVDHEYKRLRRSRKAETHTFMEPKPKRLRRSPRAESRTSSYQDGARHRGWNEEKHPAPPRDYLYPEEPVIYRREVYASPKAYPPPQHRIPLPSAEALLPSLDTDIYRRDRLDTDIYRRDRLDRDLYRRDRHRYHDSQLLDRDLRPQTEFANHDPYFSSREHSVYRDSLFRSSRPPEYHPRRSSEYHSSPGLRPEYKPPRHLYRYYS